jgi:hypothetical protein
VDAARSAADTFWQYDNPLERKRACDQLDRLPLPMQLALMEMNSSAFVSWLEQVTGIDGLVPDPHYRGGGLHLILPDGKLDVHADFNIHPRLKLLRRLNAILFLNADWRADWGGQLEFWRGYVGTGDKRFLVECGASIAPLAGRLVVFEVGDLSFHGHPEPLRCPPERCRASLATYYYTVPVPPAAHSTIYVKRPQDADDPALDALRTQRAKGRLHGNCAMGEPARTSVGL